MSTVTLRTGELVAETTFADIFARLKELEDTRPNEFCRLVIACRNPNSEVKRCVQSPLLCRRNHHVDCWNVEHYLGLIKSFDEQAHAEIDPIVRAIVLAATPAVQMPRLVSPLI